MTSTAQILDKTGELLELTKTRFKVFVRNTTEYLRVVWRYYRQPRFALADLTLLAHYIVRNPYRICKQFLLKQGAEDPYTYGETPLTTMEAIATSVGVTANDIVYELGAGRGRGCLWLRQFIGCHVVAIEQVPYFVDVLQKVISWLGISQVDAKMVDFLQADLSAASVVYLYGSSMGDEEIRKLTQRLEALQPGTKVITVSFGLEQYDRDTFITMKRFPAQFTWGTADVFVQVRR